MCAYIHIYIYIYIYIYESDPTRAKAAIKRIGPICSEAHAVFRIKAGATINGRVAEIRGRKLADCSRKVRGRFAQAAP